MLASISILRSYDLGLIEKLAMIIVAMTKRMKRRIMIRPVLMQEPTDSRATRSECKLILRWLLISTFM